MIAQVSDAGKVLSNPLHPETEELSVADAQLLGGGVISWASCFTEEMLLLL